MICYPSIQEATPLIVAGPQRCGTRFVTNVLNFVPGVSLQDEIPYPVMSKVFELIDKCEKKFGSHHKEYTAKNWEQTKHDFMFSVWANLTQGKRRKIGKNLLFYGYKTPFHEIFFDQYNKFFEPVRPKYICCIRSFIDHYFSVHARWPERNILQVAKRFSHSLRQLRYYERTKIRGCFILFFG